MPSVNEARVRIAVDSVCIVMGYFVVCAPLSSKYWFGVSLVSLAQNNVAVIQYYFETKITEMHLLTTPGGHSLVWAIWGRAAGQGMVFWPRCPKQGIQFDLLLP